MLMNNVIMFSLLSNTHLPSAQALTRRKAKGCFCSLQVRAEVQRWALCLCGAFTLKSDNNHLLPTPIPRVLRWQAEDFSCDSL